MNTEQETDKIIKKAAIKFFENNMLGKDVDTVLYEVSCKALLEMGTIIGKLKIILVCLYAIRDDIPYFEKLDRGTQERLETTILGLEEICEELEDIIDPIIN